jgi:hypothetical protein
MRTRSQPTPLSIKILIGLCVLMLASYLFDLANMWLSFGVGARWSLFDLWMVLFLAHQIVGLARLSRWPVVFQTGSFLYFVFERFIHDPHWSRRDPWLGMVLVLFPIAVYFALALPHWRKMNWAPFGRPYRPPERGEQAA